MIFTQRWDYSSGVEGVANGDMGASKLDYPAFVSTYSKTQPCVFALPALLAAAVAPNSQFL